MGVFLVKEGILKGYAWKDEENQKIHLFCLAAFFKFLHAFMSCIYSLLLGGIKMGLNKGLKI